MNTVVENIPDLNPNAMLDAVKQNLGLKNDAALCRVLEIDPPVISKVRHHRTPVSAALLIALHEASEISIRDLRYLMGDYRPHTGKSARQPGTGHSQAMSL
jgi:hypothetical protein